MEVINAILTGLFTGLGVGFANWIHENKISKLLNKINNKIEGKKNGWINYRKQTGNGLSF